MACTHSLIYIEISASWLILMPVKQRPVNGILYYTGQTHKIGEVHEGRRYHGLDGTGTGTRHYHYFRRHHLLLEGSTELT